MPETKTREIGGLRYDMELLGGRKARAVGARITPAVMHAAGNAAHIALGNLFDSLGPDDLETVAQAFFEATTVYPVNEADKKPHPISLKLREDLFDGNWALFVEFLTWGIEVNGFLGPLAALVGKARSAKEASSSRPESTGSSGGSSSPNA